MRISDFIDNPRMDQFVALVRKISLARTPKDLLTAIAEHYWTVRPSDYMISMSTKGLPEGQYRVTRQIDVASIRSGARPLPTVDPWGARTPPPSVCGGFLGELVRRKCPLLINDLDVRGDPVLGDALAHLGSAVVMPLYDEGHPRYWNIAFRKDPEGYCVEDLEHSLLVANLTAGSNTRLMLMEEIRNLNAALRHQFEEVARVQRDLLPRGLPGIPGLSIATSYLPSEQAGGDYYDFFRFQDETWGLFIADVSGHGAAAATVMAMLHGILHAYAGPGREPDEVLRYANTRLLHASLGGTFVTAALGIYDPRSSRLRLASSGHPLPLLKHGDTGRVSSPEILSALPLGIEENYDVSSTSLTLRPNDTIVLYTDGISEAMNGRRDMFGAERLSEVLTGCSGEPECVIDSIPRALREFTGTETRMDDQTLLVFRHIGD